MVVLKPSKEIRKAYPSIDWDTLSLVYTVIFNTINTSKRKKSLKINIRVSKAAYSYYSFNTKATSVSIVNWLTLRQFQSTLLHEFRHCVQDKILHITFKESEYNNGYKTHPIEIDARNFELKSLPYLLRLYNRICKQKKLFTKLNEYRPKSTKIN
jgi:hypothetical protein